MKKTGLPIGGVTFKDGKIVPQKKAANASQKQKWRKGKGTKVVSRAKGQHAARMQRP